MPDHTEELPAIDLTAMKVNQLCIIVLLVAAFILDAAGLVVAVCGVMALGTLLGFPGFKPLYQRVLRPAGIARPQIVRDHPEPHRFAQGVGAAVLLVASVALLGNSAVLGWSLSWLVVALAAINLWVGFCAGCFVYYWLNRLGVPGFVKAPPQDTAPGMRPRQGA